MIGLLKIAKITAYSQAGETKDVTASGRLEETGGVSVMRLDVSTAAPLDSELAVSVDFDIPGLARFFGDRRHKEFWCSPCFGESLREVDNNIQGFIAELENCSFTVILPLVSDDYKAVLIGTPENLLRAQVYSWQKGLNTCKCPVFVAASGENPFELLKICAETAVKVLKKDLKLIGEIYTKGSWGITASSNYRKRYRYNGSFLASSKICFSSSAGSKTRTFPRSP